MLAKTKTWTLYGIGTVITILLIYLTRDTWIKTFRVLAFGSVFSLIAAPICAKLEQKGMRRGMASFLGMMSIALILVFFLLVFIPYFFASVLEFGKRITPTIFTIMEQIDWLLAKWGISNSFRNDAIKLLASKVTPLTAGIARGSAAFFIAAGHTAFSLVIAYYLLTIRPLIRYNLLLLAPLELRMQFISALKGCKNAVMSYLAGTMKTSLFVGFSTLAGLLILRMDDAFLLALFMGILETLPFIGPFLGAIPILLAAIPLGISRTLMVLGLILVIQQLESSVIGPYFTASSTSIHPLAAILGVYLGGSLFGIFGILLTVPTMIVVRSIYWSVRSASICFEV